MGTKGVATNAAWVCQVSKGLREVHFTGCWWGIGILPSITFARLLSLKEKKVTNLQYRLQKNWSFSQINLFLLYDLKHWHSIRVSHPNPTNLTLTQGIWVREKTSLAPDLLFDCKCTLVPKNMVCFAVHDQLWMKWDLTAMSILAMWS